MKRLRQAGRNWRIVPEITVNVCDPGFRLVSAAGFRPVLGVGHLVVEIMELDNSLAEVWRVVLFMVVCSQPLRHSSSQRCANIKVCHQSADLFTSTQFIFSVALIHDRHVSSLTSIQHISYKLVHFKCFAHIGKCQLFAFFAP